jgi:hypothetical protein
MNVSMMDSYNLAWKLVYSLHGLTPGPLETAKSDPVLDTYHQERHTIAQQLIDFDRAFSSMFSGKIGLEDGIGKALTHEQFLKVFSTGNGFTSGCGIEYPENITVDKTAAENPITGTDYLQGILHPGRRLLNVRVKRFADGNRRDLQDGTLRLPCNPTITNDVQTSSQPAASASSSSHPPTSSTPKAPPHKH